MSGINSKKIRSIFLLFTLFTLSLPVFAKEKEAGKTLLTRASVFAKRSNANITLKRRSKIFERDEIHVGKSGRAQFRMVDQAIISLQENSILQIKRSKFKQGSGSNSAFLKLLTGGLRTITGAIGKGNKKAYELYTPLATIGVRGTDYEVEIVSNGMYVATWQGTIHLKSHLKNGCNMLIGRSQPYMFVHINPQGKCKGLQQVPQVFRTGHSSNIPTLKKQTKVKIADKSIIEPLQQTLPVHPAITFKHSGLNIDLSHPAKEINSKSSTLASSTPTFKVGLERYNLAETGKVSNFQQSIGGYQVAWGYWNQFSTSFASNQASKNIEAGSNGMIWTAYDPSDVSIVSARTGTARYDNVTNSLLNGSSGAINNLQIQMDVNFESGNVTNGALSANTRSDTWVAVFDGKIIAGDLDLQLNGASVVESNPTTHSPVRDANGFIAGDFIGNNAEAIIGGFGLSEDNVESNHIEGTFIVEE